MTSTTESAPRETKGRMRWMARTRDITMALVLFIGIGVIEGFLELLLRAMDPGLHRRDGQSFRVRYLLLRLPLDELEAQDACGRFRDAGEGAEDLATDREVLDELFRVPYTLV